MQLTKEERPLCDKFLSFGGLPSSLLKEKIFLVLKIYVNQIADLC